MTNFLSYAENATTAIALFDADKRLTFANASFKKIAGCGTGITGGNLAATPLDEAVKSAIDTGIEQVRVARREMVFTHDPAEASRGRIRIRVLPSVEEDGGFIVDIHIVPDTERLAQALEAERNARLRSDEIRERGRKCLFDLIEQLPIFVYMQRRDYTVAYANKKTRNLYGDPQGRLCYEMFSGRDTPCPSCPTFCVFDTGQPEEWHFSDREGRTFRIFDFPFEDEDGSPLVMEIGIDITELKRVEQKLVQAHKTRAIGVLAGGIAHDLNNNLVPIIFNIDYALGKTADLQVSEALGESLRAAYRAADLVEQVLEYSRQQNVSRSPLQLVPLVRENLDTFRKTVPESINLSMDLIGEKDCVNANPAQMQQLVLNLCSNAVQAMPGGGKLSVRMETVRIRSYQDAPLPDLGPGEYAALTVEDTGHGIEPEAVDRIFEPFYTTKKNRGGTGMGLAVVHAIVLSNGGVIHVDSQPGRGTAFRVYLPVAEPSDTPIVAQPDSRRGKATGRLLLVDDDRGARQAMARALREAGFDVSTAVSGEEGLERYFLEKPKFKLVLADHAMPGMDGVTMARRILGQDPTAKIFICTGHVEPDLETRATKIGVAGFLVKPMRPGRLIETAAQYCR